MEPRIVTINDKKLVGKRLIMSIAKNKTAELWTGFMPRRKEITNNLTSDLFSLQVYDPSYFDNFDPEQEFEKWALIEVADFTNVPAGMETFTLVGGHYAVFVYKGSSIDSNVFKYIYSDWLPKSDYLLDNRPHFEILSDKYKNNDPSSEEEIWIPVRPKN